MSQEPEYHYVKGKGWVPASDVTFVHVGRVYRVVRRKPAANELYLAYDDGSTMGRALGDSPTLERIVQAFTNYRIMPTRCLYNDDVWRDYYFTLEPIE